MEVEKSACRGSDSVSSQLVTYDYVYVCMCTIKAWIL